MKELFLGFHDSAKKTSVFVLIAVFTGISILLYSPNIDDDEVINGIELLHSCLLGWLVVTVIGMYSDFRRK